VEGETACVLEVNCGTDAIAEATYMKGNKKKKNLASFLEGERGTVTGFYGCQTLYISCLTVSLKVTEVKKRDFGTRGV